MARPTTPLRHGRGTAAGWKRLPVVPVLLVGGAAGRPAGDDAVQRSGSRGDPVPTAPTPPPCPSSPRGPPARERLRPRLPFSSSRHPQPVRLRVADPGPRPLLSGGRRRLGLDRLSWKCDRREKPRRPAADAPRRALRPDRAHHPIHRQRWLLLGAADRRLGSDAADRLARGRVGSGGAGARRHRPQADPPPHRGGAEGRPEDEGSVGRRRGAGQGRSRRSDPNRRLRDGGIARSTAPQQSSGLAGDGRQGGAVGGARGLPPRSRCGAPGLCAPCRLDGSGGNRPPWGPDKRFWRRSPRRDRRRCHPRHRLPDDRQEVGGGDQPRQGAGRVPGAEHEPARRRAACRHGRCPVDSLPAFGERPGDPDRRQCPPNDPRWRGDGAGEHPQSLHALGRGNGVARRPRSRRRAPRRLHSRPRARDRLEPGPSPPPLSIFSKF